MEIKALDVKKAHIAVSLILLVAETGIEPVTRGFSIRNNKCLLVLINAYIIYIKSI